MQLDSHLQPEQKWLRRELQSTSKGCQAHVYVQVGAQLCLWTQKHSASREKQGSDLLLAPLSSELRRIHTAPRAGLGLDPAADCIYNTLRSYKSPFCDCEHCRNTFHFSWVIMALCLVKQFPDSKCNLWTVHSLSGRVRFYKYINI